MSAPFLNPETLDDAVTEHMNLIGEVKKLQSDVVLLRGAAAQNSADVLRAVDAATAASAKCDLVLARLDTLREDIRKLIGNGHG